MTPSPNPLTRRTAISGLCLLLALPAALGCEAAPAPMREPSAPSARVQRALILMHGRGAAADDLQPLADDLAKAAPAVKFRLPAGPHPFGQGRAWYPRSAASTADTEQRLLAARAQARSIVMDIVAELRTHGVRDEQIYVGGFSQGASVALDVVLSSEGSRLGGLVSLSGGVLDPDLAILQQRAKLRAFVSHGRSDAVLDFAKSERLNAALEQAGHRVRFIQFDGGHTIPTPVRRALGEFLAAD